MEDGVLTESVIHILLEVLSLWYIIYYPIYALKLGKDEDFKTSF